MGGVECKLKPTVILQEEGNGGHEEAMSPRNEACIGTWIHREKLRRYRHMAEDGLEGEHGTNVPQ